MAYTVQYELPPVWTGRTESSSYTLHRAIITADGENWQLAGYALWRTSGTRAELVEVYSEVNVEPGNGLYGDHIGLAEAANHPLPPADRRDIMDFAVSFEDLCNINGDPLLESQVLI